MAGDTVTVCLHAFVSVFVASRWWEWTHMPWQRDHRNLRSPSLHHHHTTSSLLHKRPHMTPDPPGIHSDWGKVLTVAQQEQCSVVSERKRREGGGNSLPLVPPSIQTQKSSGVTTSQEQTGSLFFHLGDERNWAWRWNDPAPEKKKSPTRRAQIALRSERERRRLWG